MGEPVLQEGSGRVLEGEASNDVFRRRQLALTSAYNSVERYITYSTMADWLDVTVGEAAHIPSRLGNIFPAATGYGGVLRPYPSANASSSGAPLSVTSMSNTDR